MGSYRAPPVNVPLSGPPPEEWEGSHVMLYCCILTQDAFSPCGGVSVLKNTCHAYPMYLLHIN